MTKVEIWTDGLAGAIFHGEIALLFHDLKTNDFILSMKKKGLQVETIECFFPEENMDFQEDFSWLKEFPIQFIKIFDKEIWPVWKPNRYGEPADFNAFQNVEITNEEVIISVLAKGTEEEVFKRYNPYEVYGSTEKKFLNYQDLFESPEEIEEKNKKIHASLENMTEKEQDELVKKLFE